MWFPLTFDQFVFLFFVADELAGRKSEAFLRRKRFGRKLRNQTQANVQSGNKTGFFGSIAKQPSLTCLDNE
jgi:hypothetical protein